MNASHKKTNEYCEEAVTLVKDILGKQNRHCIEMNSLLYNNTKPLTLEGDSLVQVENTPKDIDSWNAVNLLCLPEYERYKCATKEAIAELRLEINDDGSCLVYSNITEYMPVLFLARDSSCNACKNCAAR